MDEKKKAPADAGKGTQEPAKKQTDNNTERENISFKDEPETALDRIKNYVLNGGDNAEKYLSLYHALSDDEKKEFNSNELSTVIFRSIIDTSKNISTLLKVTPLFSYPNDEKHTEDNKNIKKYAENLNAALEKVERTTVKAYQNYEYRKNIDNLISCLSDVTAPTEKWQAETKAVLPYLENELKKKEYNGATPEDVLIYFNVLGAFLPDVLGETDEQTDNNTDQTPTDGKHKITPQQARQAWENAKKAKDNAVKVVAKSTNQYPLDVSKAGLNLWNSNVQQGKTAFDVTKKAEKLKNPADKVLIVYDFDFSELNGITTTKNLTSYDRLVYSAIAGIRNAGNTAFTDRQVFTVIEGNKRPAANQLKKIRESIKKMARVYVTVDNAAEAEKYKSKNFYKYTGSVLPIEILENVSVNGNVTDVAYHILENKLPLIDISKERNELTTVPAKLLQVPLNKTDTNLEIGFYIQTRVKREEHAKKTEFKILLETLYKHAHIETKKQKQRAPEKVKAILDYYVKCDFIRAYKMESDSVIITLKQE